MVLSCFFQPSFLRTSYLKEVQLCLIICLPIAYLANIRNNFPESRRLLILVGLFLLPGVISVVIIYPRGHYLLLPYAMTTAMMAILLSKHTPEQEQLNHKRLLLLGLLVIALTPYFSQGSIKNRHNLDTIRFVQSLKIQEPVRLLEAEGGYNIYLGDNFQRVAEYDKDKDFHHFRADRNINMIVVTDILLKDTRFKNDLNGKGSWQTMLNLDI